MGSGKGQAKRVNSTTNNKATRINQTASETYNGVFNSFDELMDAVPDKQHMLVFMGIPGSGKSYLGDELISKKGYGLVSSDAIREELTGDAKNQHKNNDTFKIFHNRLKKGLKNGDNMIADSTALSVKARENLLSIAEGQGVEVYAIVFTDLETAAERNRGRADGTQPGREPIPNFAMERMRNNHRLTVNELITDNKFNKTFYVNKYDENHLEGGIV